MAAIKCGNCKEYHESVAEVRACFGQPTLGQVARQMSGAPEYKGPEPEVTRSVTWAAVNAAAEALPNIKSVHYAIRATDGEFRFYRVDKPQSGKWAGKTFIKVQASDEYHRLSSGPSEQLRIINEIAKDPRKAAEDYGHEIGSCAICNRTLTDPESIERGIGPICAGKEGW